MAVDQSGRHEARGGVYPRRGFKGPSDACVVRGYVGSGDDVRNDTVIDEDLLVSFELSVFSKQSANGKHAFFVCQWTMPFVSVNRTIL